MEFIQTTLVVIMTVVLWALYHKVFNVYYFGLAGIATVIFGCIMVAAVLVNIFLAYVGWIIAIGVIGFIIFAVVKSKSTNIA